MKRILDKGHVVLDSHYGSDLQVVNFARASFGKKSQEFTGTEEKILQFLMRERHGTPFESIDFTFQVKAPLAVTQEWLRHRVSSFNQLSLRYTEAKMECYVPASDAIRRQEGKPGAYHFERIIDPDTQETVRYLFENLYQASTDAYKRLLELGVAKELARYVLPTGLYTEFYWKVNARSLMNFISLRSHHTAMEEIRAYSQAIESLFAEVAPATHRAFVKNGRVAP